MKNGITSCVLKNTNDYDSANFMYFIKTDVSCNLNEIDEYKTVGSINEDQYVDLYDSFKPNINFKIKI